ncbi:MAG: F-type H+-transporting ATPase subunit gamma [Patescibacteria group bacterium]|jgi:F-type H+-transporting ATPase subunit gamma|nr:F-type H+-transporting ATPase subunit gamma [Patescibacteria group bacterium]
MGLATKAIKQKIKSVNNIKKITKTMEMVSVSKMKKTTERVTRGRAYSRYALELLHHIAGEDHISHPFLEERQTGKVLVVVISSNKGLAGAYNINISKSLGKYKSSTKNEIDCITVGKQSEKSARRNGLNIVASFIEFSEKSTSEEFLIIRDIIVAEFKTGKYEAVKVLYTEFKTSTSYKPFLMQVLPVKEEIYKDLLLSDDSKQEKSAKKNKFSQYTFEPSEGEVLDTVIRQLLEQAIFHTFLESLASEHSSRMFAMKNANDSANTMVSELTLYYNRVRQGAITQEIAEIVGGASAMN